MNEIKVNFLLNFSFSDFLTIALFTFKHYLISIIKYPINIVIILIFFISLKNRSRITNFYLTYFVVSFLLINAIFQTYPGPIFNDIPLIIDRLILQMTGFYLPYLVFVLNNQFIRKKFMKVVLLAGGLGSRLSEETIARPKPLVEVGHYPILWHIMKIYSHYGLNDFIICCGYKGYLIKEFFINYILHTRDVEIDVKK